jgi:hypothetical protein
MTTAAMDMVTTGVMVKRGFSGLSFHLELCLQGVACVLFKKTTFGSRRSKLDHLTVRSKK